MPASRARMCDALKAAPGLGGAAFSSLANGRASGSRGADVHPHRLLPSVGATGATGRDHLVANPEPGFEEGERRDHEHEAEEHARPEEPAAQSPAPRHAGTTFPAVGLGSCVGR